MNRFQMKLVLAVMLLCAGVFAQTAQTAAANNNAVVPPLVKFSGTLNDVSGKPISGVIGVTFALYKDEQGGAPLWLETQNVSADKSGHYTAMLGSTSSTGLPADIFVAGEARWLAVRPESQEEQARVLLLSVPYALKAGDAQTLGGLPASAFVQANPAAKSGAAIPGASGSQTKTAVTEATITGTGKTSYIPLWNNPTTLGASLFFQTGGKVGLNTTTPSAMLSVNGNGIFTSSAGSQALQVTQSGTGSGIVASTNATEGYGIAGNATSTTNSAVGGVGVAGFSSNPSGYGVSGSSGNVGVYGAGGSIGGLTGIGVQGMGDQYGISGSVSSSLFPANQAGVFGTTASSSSTAYGVEGTATALSGTPIGVFGSASSPSGYGVYGAGTNVGVYGVANFGVIGHGTIAGVKGTATAGGLAGLFQGGSVNVGGNGNATIIGDPGCGSGYAAVGFTSGNLSGCTNYALLGDHKGGTYVNAGGTSFIHFRSNNNELATIDNAGNVKVIGINGGGNLTVAGRIKSANLAAQTSATNSPPFASVGHCTGALGSANSNCLVPNMTLTKTTANPQVLVMATIGGVVTDPCVLANFYLVVDNKIVALSSVSGNSNNDAISLQYNSVTIMSLQDLAAGSHTFEVQEADDNSSGNCATFIGATGISEGDGGRGSLRTLIVREF
jgi:trimeric autotransporter adhesin